MNVPGVGLCPKIPLNKDGSLMEPEKSDPIPNTEAPEAINAPCKMNSRR